MIKTQYEIEGNINLKIALAADYHSHKSLSNFGTALKLISEERPDFILCPGDIFNITDKKSVLAESNISGMNFLRECKKIAPVIISSGNHERSFSDENKELLHSEGIILLNNEYFSENGIYIGGLSSPYTMHKTKYITPPTPDLEFIDSFSRLEGLKILLCHHPEYWKKYISEFPIDLTLSGHAHGGQWCIFGRGVYAPGQGVFPKYTSGVHRSENGSLIISRGMRNSVPYPRFFNPCEIVFITLK